VLQLARLACIVCCGARCVPCLLRCVWYVLCVAVRVICIVCSVWCVPQQSHCIDDVCCVAVCGSVLQSVLGTLSGARSTLSENSQK